MNDMMKKIMLLQMFKKFQEMEENFNNEFNEKESDFISDYEIKFIGVLYMLRSAAKVKMSIGIPVSVLDMATETNKMFMAHILHLLEKIGLIVFNPKNGTVYINDDSHLLTALLYDPQLKELFNDVLGIDDNDDCDYDQELSDEDIMDILDVFFKDHDKYVNDSCGCCKSDDDTLF